MKTPDTEKEDFPSEISMRVTDIVLNKESGWSRTFHNELNAYKNAIVASRDTYWKERVAKEVEGMSHNIKIEIAGISGILNGSAVSDSGQAHTAQMKLGNILEALDTLLEKFTNEDNLK